MASPLARSAVGFASSSFSAAAPSPAFLSLRAFSKSPSHELRRTHRITRAQRLAAAPVAASASASKAEDASMTLAEATSLLRAWEAGRSYSAVELNILVALDKKKPSMKGRTLFPSDPSTKPAVILVLCAPDQAQAALDAGADYAGGKEIFEPLLKGIIPLPTTVLATPRIAEELSRARDLTRFLGPKQLMPSEKKGTMVTDIESAIKANRGVVDWKVSRTGDISIVVGRPNWKYDDLEANVLTFLEDLRNSGSSSTDVAAARPTKVLRMSLTSTTGPGIPINDILGRARPSGF